MQKVITTLAVGVMLVSLVTGSAWADGKLKAPATQGPTMAVKALSQTVKAGDTFKVDIVLEKVPGVACYQLAAGAVGGKQGTLTLENILIDTARKDYVFFGGQVIPAVDMTEGRAGALQMTGSRDVTKSAYIATAVFRASADAKGTFKVNVIPGKETFLRDANASPIEFRVGKAAKIKIGEAASIKSKKRSGR